MALQEPPYIESSAADAAETSRFRLRPSGFAETGRSMKSTGKPVDEIRPRAYESAAITAMNYHLRRYESGTLFRTLSFH